MAPDSAHPRSNVYPRSRIVAHAAEALTATVSNASSIDLDWRPSLGWAQQLGLATVSGGLVFACFCAARSLVFSWPAVLIATLLFAVIYGSLKAVLVDQAHAVRMVLEQDLADPDSKFRQIHDLRVHMKVKDGHANNGAIPTFAAHCYHGFGASTFSWGFVQHLLAQRLGTVVTSHDMPGFGLTQRPKSPAQYLLSFNSRLGRAVLDSELAARSFISTTELQQSISAVQTHELTSTTPTTLQPSRLKRVVMGHSLGTICAALEALSHPQDVHAVVLVAPAIFAIPGKEYDQVTLRSVPSQYSNTQLEVLEPASAASRSGSATASTSTSSSTDASETATAGGKTTAASEAPGAAGGVGTAGTARTVSSFPRAASGAVKALCLGLVLKTLQVMQPLISLMLRGMVRSREFWFKGIMAAYYERSKVTAKVVDGYRRALMVRGFDSGFLQFLYARIVPGNNPFKLSSLAATQDVEDTNLAARLSAVVQKYKLPVLIVHGKEDRLVPVGNSRRLARMLPGSQLVVIPQCGHVPHEELGEDFVDVVCEFLGTLSA